VKAETGGGCIELNGVPSARAETGGGGIIAQVSRIRDRTDSTLETSAGDINYRLSRFDLSISIRANIERRTAQILSDFPTFTSPAKAVTGTKNRVGRRPVKRARTVLKARTNSGNIKLSVPAVEDLDRYL